MSMHRNAMWAYQYSKSAPDMPMYRTLRNNGTATLAQPQSWQVGQSSGEFIVPYRQSVYCVSEDSVFN